MTGGDQQRLQALIERGRELREWAEREIERSKAAIERAHSLKTELQPDAKLRQPSAWKRGSEGE